MDTDSSEPNAKVIHNEVQSPTPNDGQDSGIEDNRHDKQNRRQPPASHTNDKGNRRKEQKEKEKLEQMEKQLDDDLDNLIDDIMHGKGSGTKGQGQKDIKKANKILDKKLFSKDEMNMVKSKPGVVKAMEAGFEEDLDSLLKSTSP